MIAPIPLFSFSPIIVHPNTLVVRYISHAVQLRVVSHFSLVLSLLLPLALQHALVLFFYQHMSTSSLVSGGLVLQHRALLDGFCCSKTRKEFANTMDVDLHEEQSVRDLKEHVERNSVSRPTTAWKTPARRYAFAVGHHTFRRVFIHSSFAYRSYAWGLLAVWQRLEDSHPQQFARVFNIR